MSVPAYRTPDERFVDLPGWTFTARYADQDGLRMHFVEQGRGDPILVLHGEPTWGFLYRKMIPRLSRDGRVVVPDLFGFGRSDKPTERDWYSYDAHYGSIERLAVHQLGLSSMTIVMQDWGGPIGLSVGRSSVRKACRRTCHLDRLSRDGWPTAPSQVRFLPP